MILVRQMEAPRGSCKEKGTATVLLEKRIQPEDGKDRAKWHAMLVC